MEDLFSNRLLEILELSKIDCCNYYNFTLNKNDDIIYYFKQNSGDNVIARDYYIMTSSPLIIKSLSYKESNNLLVLKGSVDYRITNNKGSQMTLNNASVYPSFDGVTIEFYNYTTNKFDLIDICNDLYNIYNS